MNTPNTEETIFSSALQLKPAERAAYLDQACGADVALRQRVEALLNVHKQAEHFLEDSASPALQLTGTVPIPLAEKAGDHIGRYKLLQQIGEGGCGVVYMAEQEQPVRRRVALKVIKLGMDTRNVIARFEAERQALAMMDHPHIAKVFDAGATETGRPYFVMELVRGIKITDYCDQNNLSTAKRLDLFVQVCQAIQHAHQKGIIHRDIKPSNVLVADHDGVPVPKVIDFGIAKATTNQRLTDKTLFTALEQFMGTPAYMSPEQARLSGLDIDTRTDIYSLGVLLYELLTGRTPFDVKELLAAGLDEMRRTICEKEPARPSTRLSTILDADLTTIAQRRQTDAPKLLHLLRGDLDWVVMKALEKDRTRRYETANGFAADVERHLNNEPVVARPMSNFYRFQKLVRRNKLTVAAVSAVAIALIIGLSTSTWMFFKEKQARIQAETEAEKNRQANELFGQMFASIFRSASPSARKEYATAVNEAANKLISTELHAQPVIEAHIRTMFGQAYAELHEDEKAEAMLRAVLELRRKGLGDANRDVVLSLQHLGWLLAARSDLAGAEAMYRESVRIAKKVSSGVNPDVVDSLGQLGMTLEARGDYVGAEAIFREALAVERKLPLNDPASLRVGEVTIHKFASFLVRRGKTSEAEQELSAMLTEANQSNRKRAELLTARGDLRARLGRWKEATADLAKVVELNPDDHWPWYQLAPLLVQTGDLEGYRRHCAQVLARFDTTRDPVVAERMAKDCLILPSPIAELGTVTKMAEMAVAAGTNHWGSTYFQFAKGLAEYREGRFGSAAERQQIVVAARKAPFLDSQAYLVLAMAYNQLKQPDAARTALANGIEIAQTRLPQLQSGNLGNDWADVLIVHILMREAKALIEGANAQDETK